MNQYYVYIMTNKSRTLYTGVTNDSERRVYEHKQKLVPGFTTKYNIDRLGILKRRRIFRSLFLARNKSKAGCAPRK